MFERNDALNPWTHDDDAEHALSVLEWWAVETFFQTKEDKKRWCLKVALSQWCVKRKKIGCLCNMTLFDQETNKHYVHYSWIDGKRLESEKNRFSIRHKDASIKGGFPTYEMHFHDPENHITIDFTQQATSYPHWISQDVTGGWLPMGLGCYRYGILPKNHIQGTMMRHDQTMTIEGTGYYEHVWGNFDYDHPLSILSGLGKTLGVYTKLLLWWLSHHHRRLPRSITFATENNPFGYDWVWAVFDNGWSLFYGNAMFWIMDGPSAGILIFTKDGKTYTDFSDVTFHYKTLAYAKEHDFYYPTALELLAKNEKETLQLTFTMTGDRREYVRSPHPKAYWKGLAICEAPGTVEGYYRTENEMIPLTGFCKIEPQRELSSSGHNTKKIDVLLPPHGMGITVELVSHKLLKKIRISLQIAPHLKVQWKKQTIHSSQVHSTRL